MRLPRILSRYILREVAAYGLVGFLAFATILVAQNLLRRLEDLLAIGFGGHDFLVILGCFLAMFAAYAAPVAFQFGVLLAMGRLSSDSEVTAMQASGLGLRTLVVPVLVLGMGGEEPLQAGHQAGAFGFSPGHGQGGRHEARFGPGNSRSRPAAASAGCVP